MTGGEPFWAWSLDAAVGTSSPWVTFRLSVSLHGCRLSAVHARKSSENQRQRGEELVCVCVCVALHLRPLGLLWYTDVKRPTLDATWFLTQRRGLCEALTHLH